MNLQLYYDKILVGDIIDAFCDQATWFGSFQSRLDLGADILQMRLHDFIVFCEDWHKRLADGIGGDASEFDQFRDVLTSGLWFIHASDAAVSKIDQAPSFTGGELSWRLI
jgi:hypothetical protein